MNNELTIEQQEGLRNFARDHGRNWKSALRDAWMTGIYRGREDACYLQQVRNQYGPS
jgi:hypothetical protein